MAKIELNYMLGDEVWFLFPVFERSVLKGFVPCKGVVQDIEITLMGGDLCKVSCPLHKSFDVLSSAEGQR